MKDKTKSIFCWLNEITVKKTPSEEFTGNDWEKFNSWLMHRFISCNRYYIELANLAQSLPPQNKKQVYNLYKEMIPKGKSYFKYIKSKTKTPKTELTEAFVKIYKCSTREVVDYLLILDKSEIKSTLQKSGYQPKEITKMLK